MTETCWDILGIAPTADERAIKKAYALKLKQNKPDKDPAGFRAVREAYEQALEARYWLALENDSDDWADTDVDAENETDIETDTKENDFAQYNDNQDSTTQNSDTPNKDTQNNDNRLTAEQLDSLLNSESLTAESGSGPEIIEIYLDSQTLDKQILDNSIDSEASQLSAWQNEWLDCVNVDTETETENSVIDDDSSEYQISPSRQFNQLADQKLTQCLQHQFSQLTLSAIDTVDDFEEALIVFFDQQQSDYPQAYQLAKQHFNWQQHLDSWDNYQYPWSILNWLDQRLNIPLYLQSPVSFQQYIASKYPMVYRYWDFELPEHSVPSRWQFFAWFLWPHTAYDVKQQLEGLIQELDSYVHSNLDTDPANGGQNTPYTDAKDWRHHPQLLNLERRLGFFTAVQLIDFILIGLLCWMLFQSLGWVFDYQNALIDGISSWIIISLCYLYWQTQLSLITLSAAHDLNQNHNTEPDIVQSNPLLIPFLRILTAVSLLVYGLLYANHVINSDASEHYLALHSSGFIFILLLNLKNAQPVSKQLVNLIGILLLFIVATFHLKMTGTMTTVNAADAISVSPIFWLLLTLPVALSTLAKKSDLLATISHTLSNYLLLVPLFMFYILMTNLVVPLLDHGIIISALLLAAAIIMIMLMTFKAIAYFNFAQNQ